MLRKIVICLPLTVFLLIVSFAEAQQPTKLIRIGYLTAVGPSPSQTLLQGLRDLGYVVGQNIAIEYRSADGKRDRLSHLADELVRLKVDIIVADGSGPSLEGEKSYQHDPYCDDEQYRSNWKRTDRQPCPPRGKRHGVDEPYRRAGWKIAGTAQGDRAATQPCGDCECRRPGECALCERDRAFCASTWS